MQLRVVALVVLAGFAYTAGLNAAGKASVGSQLNGMGTSTVFEGHDRFPLDTRSLPQVGRLLFAVSDPGERVKMASCTGELIGVRSVLTAAHCVRDTLDYNAKLDAYNAQVRRHNQNLDDDEDPVPLAKPRTIIFQPGLIGGKLPSGGKNVAADMSQVWIGDFDVHNSLHVRRAEDLVPAIVRVTPGDYAVITLRETPSNANFSNLGALPVSTEPLQAGVSLVSVGYAGDFDDANTAGVDGNCHVRQVNANGSIFHDCAIEHGASGGPLLTETINGTRLTKDNEQRLRQLATDHPDQVQVAYQIVGVITSEIPIERESDSMFPPGFGDIFGDDRESDRLPQYSSDYPNIANGVPAFIQDVNAALQHEKDAGLKANGAAPVFRQELQSAQQPARSNDHDDNSDDDDGDM